MPPTTEELLAEIHSELAENTAITQRLLQAFPGGDTDGHRRYHQAVIERIELRNRLVKEALIKVTQAGALAGFSWVMLAIWQYFKITVKQ